MKEIMAVIRPERWRNVKAQLVAAGVPGFTNFRVQGRGRERGLRYLPRAGAEECVIGFLPKRMVSMIVQDSAVDEVVRSILAAANTGSVGDGKVFVLPAEEAIRVRTGSRGLAAMNPEPPSGSVREEDPDATPR